MQGFSALGVTSVLVAFIHVCVLSNSVEVSDSEINSLVFLGSVDGKSYFYELWPLRTWREAKEVCNISNMALASITSNRQVTFLNEATEAGFSNYTYYDFWTAGYSRLRIEAISQFHWDTDNSIVSDHGTGFFEGELIEQCLYYDARASGGRLYSAGCKYTCGVLCEAYHSL